MPVKKSEVQMTEKEREDKFFNKTLEYLLRSPKTEFQIRQYLYKKQLEPWIVAKIVSRLCELGYINDDEYVKNYTEAKSAKYGANMIRKKLYGKGIKCDEIDAGDQTELVEKLAEKYMRNKEPSRETFAKLYRFLLSKGFDAGEVCAIVDKCKSE